MATSSRSGKAVVYCLYVHVHNDAHNICTYVQLYKVAHSVFWHHMISFLYAAVRRPTYGELIDLCEEAECDCTEDLLCSKFISQDVHRTSQTIL